MHYKYLFIALLGMACVTSSQASTPQTPSATPSPTAYVMPSLKDDIVKRYISWTCSPWIASVVYLVCFVTEVFGDVGIISQKNGALIGSTLVSFAVSALLALALASFTSMWKVQADDKHDAPPFWRRFWQVFRFLGCTTLWTAIIVVLGFNRYLDKVLPRDWAELLAIFIYPFVLSLVIAIICLIYDHAMGGGDKQKEGLPQEGTQAATPAPHDQPNRPAHDKAPLPSTPQTALAPVSPAETYPTQEVAVAPRPSVSA